MAFSRTTCPLGNAFSRANETIRVMKRPSRSPQRYPPHICAQYAVVEATTHRTVRFPRLAAATTDGLKSEVGIEWRTHEDVEVSAALRCSSYLRPTQISNSR